MTPPLPPNVTTDPRRSTVFISYHRESGTEFAQQLKRDLESAGHRCWLDTTSVPGGAQWGKAIPSAIRNSAALVVVVTDKTLQSLWVRKEIQFALKLDKFIVPVLVQDVPRDDDYWLIDHLAEVNFFDCDPLLALSRLLDCLPPPTARSAVPAVTPASQPSVSRALEIAYLDRLTLEELLDTDNFKYKYTPLGGTAQMLRQRAEIRAVFEFLPYGQAQHAAQERQPFEDAIAKIRELKQAVLLGEPGGGKTTTLWKLAAELVAEALADPARPLPLLVRLGKWDQPEQPLKDFIATQMGELGAYLDPLLKAGRATLLLDGLNELPTDQRPAKYPQVQSFIETQPGVLAVVSCRAQDYTLDLKFDRINITPLDALRIREFATKYLGDVAGEALFWKLASDKAKNTRDRFLQKFTGQLADPERVFWTADQLPAGLQWGYEWREQKEKDNSLWRQWLELRETPSSLMVLARNPYMLLMLVSVYKSKNQLPENRGELFKWFVDELLNREHRREAIPAATRQRLIEQLARVAFEMQTRRLAPEADEAQQATTVLHIDEARSLLGDEPLLKLAGSASLLSLGEQVRFTHQLLQEYFAAQYLDLEIKGRQVPAAKFWPPERWWERNNWEEAAILLAGLYNNDCSEILEWLAEANPEIAAQCLVRSGAHTPEATRARLRDRWLPRLTDLKREPQPRARAAVGRALGLAQLDNRPGVGVIQRNGVALPDLQFIKIPAGEFQSGHKDESDNLPQTIWLEAFEISRYPVTCAQFQTFVDDAEGASQERWYAGLAAKPDDCLISQPYFKYFDHAYANHPREMVNWYQAVAFCRWLAWRSDLPPDSLRLPTEFEWEKAARGTDGRLYPYKGKYDTKKANTESTIGQTSAVGIYPQGASPYGVEEMSGNVWEWCLSTYDKPTLEARKENLGTDKTRVLRGGAWDDFQMDARAVYRYDNPPGDRNVITGFRVVVVSPPS